MDKLIIDSSTRIIRAVTSEENPSILLTETVIEMPSKVFLPGSGRFVNKLDSDNLTIIQATAEEKEALNDRLEPKRVTRRDLVSKLLEMSKDKSLPKNIQQFSELFLEYIS